MKSVQQSRGTSLDDVYRTGITQAQLLRAIAAAVNVAAGFALVAFAAVINRYLAEQGLGTPGQVIAIRLVGIALFAVGVGFWPALGGRRILRGLLFYSAFATLYLATLMLAAMVGTGTWPARLLLVGAASHGVATCVFAWAWLRR
ncbi:MAG: hypothetical protein U1E60_29920 [Reyranellaceae bacterium]